MANQNNEKTKTGTITLTLHQQIIDDLNTMSKNSNQSIDTLAAKALLMFIATHGDYLGTKKTG